MRHNRPHTNSRQNRSSRTSQADQDAQRTARAALRRGYLVMEPGRPGEAARRAFADLCDSRRKPEVTVRLKVRYAEVRLDLAPTGAGLSREALQFVADLFEWFSAPLSHSKARRAAGADAQSLRLWARGATANECFSWARRIPISHAEHVAAELWRIASADVARRLTPARALDEACNIARAAAGADPNPKGTDAP